MIDNQKLRTLVALGPNFREAKTINWGHCTTEISSGLDAYIAKVCAKFSEIEPEHLDGWKNKVLKLVDSDIVRLKRNIKSQRTNPILKQSEVLDYLSSFHKKFL